MTKRFGLVMALLCCSFMGYGQDLYWPSPEIEQMYKQAKQYLSRGAVKQSIVLFQQAVQLAPDVMILHRDLAQALNIAGDYEEAYSTIKNVLESNQADEITYQVAGAALLGKKDKKQTKRVLERGIKQYPHSGMLFEELGKYHEANSDLEFALDAWLRGIEGDPAFHLNYYNAARIYAQTSKPIWTIIYGEMYVNLDRHSTRAVEIKKMMLQSYNTLFTTSVLVPKYGSNVTEGEEQSFEVAVLQTLQQLSPVVSDGMTTENLVMLRARFAMDWSANYSNKYPFSLFNYHEKMLRDGKFDAYSQWMFGQVENAKQYDSWAQFHKEALPQYEVWVQRNEYKPLASDFYNSRNTRALFAKKKK